MKAKVGLGRPALCLSPAVELHHYLSCPVVVHKLELADVACPHTTTSIPSLAPCMLLDALPSLVLCQTSLTMTTSERDPAASNVQADQHSPQS